MRRAGQAVDYVAITSPNYLHDSHIRFALRSGADAICEKPLVLNPHNIDGLLEIEADTGRKVNTILQLRVHPSIIALRDKIIAEASLVKHEVDLTYITSRGRWYLQSWKGDEDKSGGIATNIGVHFFDMLYFVFGNIQSIEVHFQNKETVSGYLELENARVRWFLSINEKNLPEHQRLKGFKTYRALEIDGKEFEFSGGFNDLHTTIYRNVISGKGFSLEDNRVAIETVAKIRSSKPHLNIETEHPFLRLIKKN
jgi:UDP-N-acetyl-2-amino-2-deoxyglucuronate dehydrogenase